MKDDLFQELLESVREGGAIMRGERMVTRSIEVPERDKCVRKSLRFSSANVQVPQDEAPGSA